MAAVKICHDLRPDADILKGDWRMSLFVGTERTCLAIELSGRAKETGTTLEQLAFQTTLQATLAADRKGTREEL